MAEEPTQPFAHVLPLPKRLVADEEIASTVSGSGSVELGEGFVLGAELAPDPRWRSFLATHPQHGSCLVRVLAPELVQARGGALLLDARARLELDHPGLERVLGLGREPRPWLALARPAGTQTNLAELLADPAAEWTPEDVFQLGEELLHALDAAHGAGAVHGDLRPECLLLGEGRLVITGFGLPAAVSPDGLRRAFPGGPELGGGEYAAPELFLGGSPERAADLYSLAAILCHLASEDPPNPGSPEDAVKRMLGEEPLAPWLEQGLPAELAAALRLGLARSPRERPLSAAAYWELWTSYAGEYAARRRRFVQSARVLLGALGAILLGLYLLLRYLGVLG